MSDNYVSSFSDTYDFALLFMSKALHAPFDEALDFYDENLTMLEPELLLILAERLVLDSNPDDVRLWMPRLFERGLSKDAEIASFRGGMAFGVFSSPGTAETLRALSDVGVSLCGVDSLRHSVLWYAVKACDLQTVEFLIEHTCGVSNVFDAHDDVSEKMSQLKKISQVFPVTSRECDPFSAIPAAVPAHQEELLERRNKIAMLLVDAGFDFSKVSPQSSLRAFVTSYSEARQLADVSQTPSSRLTRKI